MTVEEHGQPWMFVFRLPDGDFKEATGTRDNSLCFSNVKMPRVTGNDRFQAIC